MLEEFNLFETVKWCFTITSLVGAYLNVHRNRWGFFLWMIANSFWMGVNFYIGEYAQSALFGCFLYLAVQGFFTWKDEEVVPVKVRVKE